MHIDPTFLTGKAEEHVVSRGATKIHRDVIAPLERLVQKAKIQGFDLRVASGFRDFQRQAQIWNEKCLGKRSVLSFDGQPVDIQSLPKLERIKAILRWSALPGASRHHWGTDLDIYDHNATLDGYQLRLVPEEAEPNGPFYEFSRWLTKALPEEKFFRPYGRDRGGVSPEWWHVSFAPISTKYLQDFSLTLLENTIRAAEIELKKEILANLDWIYRNYVLNIEEPTFNFST